MGEDATRPRLSVVVPAYNAARTLPKTLESLLAQTFTDWEAVVVDDGSTDLTYDVARTFERDPRISAYRLPFNAGAAAAANVGLKMAAGEYIAVLAADDYWLPEFAERAVAMLRHDSAAAGFYSDFIEWYEAEGIKRVHRCPPFDRDLLARMDFVNFSALVVRGPFLFDPDWEPVADWDAVVRLTRDRPLFHASEVLSVRRIHSAQVSAGLGGPRMMLKRLLLPYRYAGFAGATRAALRRLAGAAWWLTRHRQTLK